MKKNAIGLILFLTGFTTMAFELVGSRILAPYFGTSIIVWTALIGIILASLSLGYWLGGRLADQPISVHLLPTLFGVVAMWLTSILYIYQAICTPLMQAPINLELKVLLAGLAIFFVPSTILGLIVPYTIKQQLDIAQKSGKTIGDLYAISSLGSIAGVFVGGFILLPQLGTLQALLFLAILMAFAVFLCQFTTKTFFIFTGCFLYILIAFFYRNHFAAAAIDVDSSYNRILIYDSHYGDQPVKIMQINDEYSSAMLLNSEGLATDYPQYFRLIELFAPQFKHTLMIGGAAYEFPKFYLKQFKEAYIDVVEIDPAVTALAQKYFNLKPNPRLTIFHEDGRVFLNKNNKKYDAIIMDAFKSHVVPFHLSTIESAQRLAQALTDEGVLILSIVSSIQKENNEFLLRELQTLRQVFASVRTFQVGTSDNIMLVAQKKATQALSPTLDPILKKLIQSEITLQLPSNTSILTDDNAMDYYYVPENR